MSLLVLVTFLYAVNVYAINVDSVVRKTVNNYKGIKTIQSEISEHFHSNIKDVVYSGRYYSNGDTTIIRFVKPFKQSILITPDSIYWYFPDDNKIYTGAKIGKSDIKAFQRENGLGFINNIKKYNIKKEMTGNIFSKKIKVTVTPKIKRKSTFSGIIAYLNPKLNVVSDVEYYDLSGYEMLEQHFRHFRKINGFDIATSISTIIYSPVGNIENDVTYKRTLINQKINSNVFNLDIGNKNIRKLSLFNQKGGSK